MGQIGKLIIITGATASGKDTVVAELFKLNLSWKKIVTITTRPIRPDEKDGVDYYFVTEEVFQKMKAHDGFLETVEYAGNNYGTTKSAFNRIFDGQTYIWRIDPSRAAKVNQLFDKSFEKDKAQVLKNNTRVVYLDVPDKEILYQRLGKRGLNKTDIEKRIKQDEKNWQEGHFDNVVINYNGRLNKTVQKVIDLVKT